MRPRLPPRTSGALVDWVAFKEAVWNFYIIGWWLLMWANYYTFYYVRNKEHFDAQDMQEGGMLTQGCRKDCLVRHRYFGFELLVCFHSRHCAQWCRNALPRRGAHVV